MSSDRSPIPSAAPALDKNRQWRKQSRKSSVSMGKAQLCVWEIERSFQ